MEIIREGLGPFPQLTLPAIGGSRDAVVIECCQPAVLWGKPSELGIKEAESVVEKSVEKAERQIGTDVPGMFALCGSNQSSDNLSVLREVVGRRLAKTVFAD